jgi:hypothetical protein
MRSALKLVMLPLAACGPLGAQCAMCYRNAAAQSAQGIQAMNLGILALLIPLVAVAGGICWATYRADRDSR